LSHVDPKINGQFIDTPREEYENIFEDESGKYLGMDLDFSTDGVCKITMLEYIKEFA
jgi:hypothetical protein